MSKVICVDTSGLFVPCVKVYNRLLEKAVDKNKQRLVQKYGKTITDEWSGQDFIKELKSESNMPFVLPPSSMYFNSLLSCLKKIGVDKEDTVIMALEGKSWRKSIADFYKAQRKGMRDSDDYVDWSYQFKRVNQLHDNIDRATNFHFVRHPKAEADDVIAMAPKVFTDRLVVVLTGDKDLYQLAYYKNVRLFSFNKKCKGSKGMYDVCKNPLKLIHSKAEKGDVADNIIPHTTDTAEDFELRYKLVNLLELPEYIEEPLKDILSNLPEKDFDLDNLPNFKNAKEKFLKIYKKDKVITPEYCFELLEKRHKAKLKKQREKRQQKKKEKENGKKSNS